MNNKQLSYEDARAELVEVVQKLEAGAASLEESLTLWERGEELADVCQSHLEGARERLNERMGEPDDNEDELVSRPRRTAAESRFPRRYRR